MANSFKGYDVAGVTTEATVFTGPVDTQSTVIGLGVANVGTGTAQVSVKRNGVYVVKNATVPEGGSLIAVGGDQKLVVEAGGVIVVSSNVSVDVTVSTLEIS
jgi:hypothetical protein